MSNVEVVQTGLNWAHQLYNMVTADLTAEQAAWVPPGTANPIGAQMAHAVCSEDAAVRTLLNGQAPLYASDWAGRTGISDPQWRATPEWAHSVTVDLAALRDYTAAVAAATDAYVAGLTDAELFREIDLTAFGFGQRSVNWALQVLVIGHINNMAGEISVLKGVQGGKGYPF